MRSDFIRYNQMIWWPMATNSDSAYYSLDLRIILPTTAEINFNLALLFSLSVRHRYKIEVRSRMDKISKGAQNFAIQMCGAVVAALCNEAVT